MKESVTKFDLESAFKALDEIDFPTVENGIRANRPALTEIFSRKTKFDSLFEEYYDIDSSEGLDDAKAAREAEVAKAKLDRIEKIVDLDADSPEDLLTSYVGKYIMQCPQCMTLFYKDKEDVVEAEDDPNTVNVNEVCQHCGNESGYTLVGKVGEAEAEAPAEPEMSEEENLDLDIAEEPTDEATEEPAEDDLEIDLDAINLDDEPVEEEKTEEAFVAHTGETLVEDVQEDKELDAKLEAHNEYIEYLRAAIANEEEALEKATNEQVKVAIQRNIDAFKADLEAALPDAVKNDEAVIEEETVEESEPVDAAVDETAEEAPVEDAVETEEVVESLTESLHEETDLDVSADEFEALINSPEFKKPISDSDARAMLDAEKEAEEKESVEEAATEPEAEILEEGIFDWFKGLFTKKLKSREDIAEFILNNALLDYEKATIDKKGTVTTDDSNKKYHTFVVVGFKDAYKSGKKITMAPSYNNKDLVVGMKYPEAKKSYTDAENIAKGWSMRDGNGPAIIYLAKDDSGADAAFLCQYFKGDLDAKSDQLTKYKDVVLNNIESSKLMKKGGSDQSDTRNIKVSEVKPGMKAKFKKGIAEITKVEDSELADNKSSLTLKFEDGSERTADFSINDELVVLRDSIKNESLDTVMSDVEELQEAALEKLISDSLVEAYGNVAGFRLTGCEYLNEKLSVNGTAYFTSGKTRKLTYTFTEAYTAEDEIKLQGLNEKLGLDKQFILAGKIDRANKTFITESFKCNK